MKKLRVLIAVTIGIVLSMAVNSYAGWVQTNGSWMYLMDEYNQFAVNRFIFDNGKWYYFGQDGIMYVNRSEIIDGKKYWFDASGAMLVDTYSPEGEYVSLDGTTTSFKNIYNDYSTDYDQYVNSVVNMINEHRGTLGHEACPVSNELCIAAKRLATGEIPYSNWSRAIEGTGYEDMDIKVTRNTFTEDEFRVFINEPESEVRRSKLARLCSTLPVNRDRVELGVGINKKEGETIKIFVIGAGTALTEQDKYNLRQNAPDYLKEMYGWK